MKKFKVSVVVPAFNEADNLYVLTDQLVDILSNYDDYEVIIVNDGSCDNSVDILKEINQKNHKIHYISLSRNFGHQYALKAGLDCATGDCVISMDADLQHPPYLIPQMVDTWKEGVDIVYTVRRDTGTETWFKRVTSACFYKVFNVLTELKVPSGAADFRLLDRKVVNVLKNMTEKALFLRGLIFWMGFRQKAIQYHVQPRHAGKSSYNFKKMLSFAIVGAVSFSTKPLRLAIYLGFIISSLGCLLTLYVLYMKLFGNGVISGWSSIMSVLLILGGAQLFIMGIIGEYIGRIFIEMKNRPSYIIAETSLTERK